MKHVRLFEQFVNEAKVEKMQEQFISEKSLPKRFGSEEQFDWKDVEQKSTKSFIGRIKNAKYKMDMEVPDIKRLFIETFDVLTKKFGYEDHQALNYLNAGGYAAYHVLNNHDGIDGERRYAYNPEGRMEEILLGFEKLSTWKKLAKTFDNGGKIKESVIPNMKHTHHDEQFLNEAKVDKKYFDKVVKVLSKSKYPFTIMLVTKWNEIDIVIGYDAPDYIVDDIDQKLMKAGMTYGGSSGISISGDSSNYSRREYDEIARINGGHKDY